jgi:hypothetical protein
MKNERQLFRGVRRMTVAGFAWLVFVTTVWAATPPQPIISSLESLSPARIEREFVVPPFGVEHQVRLSLESRIDWKNLDGSNLWIRVAVNGNFLTKQDLLNKRDEFRLRDGLDLTWSQGNRWRVLYSPDFEQAVKNVKHPNACPGADPYHYAWNITPYVQPGKNRLLIDNLQVLAKPTTLVLRNVRFEVGSPQSPPPPEAVTPAPTGPLSRFIARGPQVVPIEVRVAGNGRLCVAVAGQQFTLTTRTSLPQGKWHEPPEAEQPGPAIVRGQSAEASWDTAMYRIRRRVTVEHDHVDVSDTFTNRSDDLIGVMYENRLQYAERPREVRLAGRLVSGESANGHNAAHPSSFAAWRELGLGLVAVDDVFRVHVKSFVTPGVLGLADEQFGLAPGKSITLKWGIYPMPHGDYWDFINAVRRVWGANYMIPGPVCFTRHFRTEQSVEQYRQWIRQRGLKMVAGRIAQYSNGRYAHGTGICYAPQWVAQETDWTRKVLAAAPDVKALAYFHAQCCTEPGGEEKYADSRLIDEQGEHLGYPYAYRLPLYLPTRENSYGKALWRFVHTCLDDIGTSGLYWDEMSHSILEFAYQAPWDGCTVRIDPKTHAVKGRASSVTLLMQPLQLDIVKYLRDRGKFLMANTQATTRTMLEQHIVRFVETGTYSAMVGTHLGCPLGLGNHHLEKTQADAARNAREILRQGGVYYGWQYLREPATWNFTDVMYPITPVELHDGVVLGVERILTSRSGCFGWPDGAAATVYVVDAKGNRVVAGMVREIHKNDRRFYEIRMPGDHFAILVKRS